MANDRKLRLRTANRKQLGWVSADIESLLDVEHPARAIWDSLERLDLRRFYEGIKSVEATAGREATDPRILLCLWLYATMDGVGSAREIARLTTSEDAYRWICGGVTVAHTVLSDFRRDQGAALDDLMTKLLSMLMAERLITLQQVAQDGMRVRASAAASSYRRGIVISDCIKQVREQIRVLRAELDADPSVHARRRLEAQERRAREQQERFERAMAAYERAEEVKESNREKQSERGTGEARASITDPDARVMKMADGGFRPAYNVQFATDVSSRFIVGVDVTNIGSDMSQLNPMLDQIQRRLGRLPNEALVDGGFANTRQIEAAAARNVTVLAPIKKPRKGYAPREVRKTDSPAVAQWLHRMRTRQAKFEYRKRAATAEPTNAHARATGLGPLCVRGLPHVRTVALMTAIALNLRTWTRLRLS
jgi:transposase